jgi:UPF0755 protein
MRLKIIIPVLAAALISWGLFHPSWGEKKTITITRGESLPAISRTLKESGIISSRLLFKAAIKITGSAKKIKAGTYRVPKNINYFALIKELQKGYGEFIRVTIPEGFTTEQIAERLAERGVIKSGEEFIREVLERDLRGFLFPETYYFSPRSTPEKIIGRMRDQFFLVVNEELMDEIVQSEYNLKEIVTLASLVEKEAKVSRERPIMADIFRKRLEIRMYLESCASILFALGEHRDKLYYKDLEIDSPYNTYRNFGLPPTPICNPGYESLHAAVYPADTEYMFFFARPDGTHIFSKNYKEHLDLQKRLK